MVTAKLSTKKDADRRRWYKEEKEKKLYGEAESKYAIVKDRPVGNLDDDGVDKVRFALSVIWQHNPLLCQELPEAYAAKSGVMSAAFRCLGMEGPDKALDRARHWECVMRYTLKWYQSKLDGILKCYTDNVNIRK